MPDDEKETLLQSTIFIKFAAPGSAEFEVSVQNAGPPQLLAAAEFLRLMATRQINDQWTQQAMTQMRQQHELMQVQRMLGGKAQ